MSGETKPRPLLTPGEVADMFNVSSHTVARWVALGKLHPVHTPSSTDGRSGHRRYFRDEMAAMMAGTPLTDDQLDELRARLVRGEL